MATNHFAEWLTEHRVAARYSIRELAQAAGVSHAAISGYESRSLPVKIPKADTLRKITDALGNSKEERIRLYREAVAAAEKPEIELNNDPPENYEDWPLELRQALAHTRTLPRASQEFVYKLWLEQARAHADIEVRRREAERKLIEREALLQQKL